MNLVINSATGAVLGSFELAFEANKLAPPGKKVFSPLDFIGPSSRLAGVHCNCNGNGHFKLLPIEHGDVQSGGKRYMQCIFCGCWSHL